MRQHLALPHLIAIKSDKLVIKSIKRPALIETLSDFTNNSYVMTPTRERYIPSSSQSEQHLRPEGHVVCHTVVGNAWRLCPTQART